MPGHITYQPTERHPCNPPNPDAYPVGTRWTCDTCRDFWTVMPTPPAEDGTEVGNWWRRSLPYPGPTPTPPSRWWTALKGLFHRD